MVLAAVGLLIFGLLEGGQAWPWLSRESCIVFGLTALLLIAIFRVERHAAEPVMPGWLWRRRVLGGSNIAMLGMGLVMMAPNAYLPTFSQSVQGLGAIGAGFVLASMSIGWPTASALSGRLYLRIGFRDTAFLGTVLIVLASERELHADARPAAGMGGGAQPGAAGSGLRAAIHAAFGGRAIGRGPGAARRGHRRQHVFALPGAEPGARRCSARSSMARSRLG